MPCPSVLSCSRLASIGAALILTACTGDKDTDTGPTGSDDTGDTAVTGCQETGGGTLPDDAEWLTVDGQSTDLFSFADIETWEYTGYYGTHDLNTAQVHGANGFRLERPGQVVGVAAMWANLPAEPTEVPVIVSPDFGSDGYMWDTESPYAAPTRCLTDADEGSWVEYVLEEPEVLDQPHLVFAGYHREEAADAPELYMEDTYNDAEPYYTGARFTDIDEEVYYLGSAFPWYVWQVRLAVVYDEVIEDEDKPFQLDESLSGSSRVSWGDYDNDGDDDVMTSGPSLYQNNGDGTFSDVTSAAFSAGSSSNGGVWGDYDNDGCLDYFGQGGSYSGTELLLHNECDGTFTDVTTESGIHDLQDTRDCDG
ncbi:MAG: VCBS repeat-containing protein, partial [Myxococcota bacterium]|nr:VCBS repeat-containing protein [Myxococcota bacterium]